MSTTLFLALVFFFFLSLFTQTQSQQNKTRLGLGLIDLESDGLSSFSQQVIDQINQDRNILPKYDLYNNNPPIIFNSSTTNFVINQGALTSIRNGGFGLVGPSNSSLAEIIAITAGDFNETNISYYAGSSDLSNKEVYPYFYRTNPSDAFQGFAIADLIAYYGWGDIVVLSENSDYGLDLTENFINRAIANGATILQVYFYSVTITRIEVGLLEIRDLGPRIIVVLTSENTFRDILRAAAKLNMIGKPYVYIASTTTTDNLIKDENGNIDSNYKSNAIGVLCVGDRMVNYNTPYLERFDNIRNLSLRFQYLTTALYAYAHALDRLLEKENLEPNEVTGDRLSAILKQLSFKDPVWPNDPPVQFDQNGDKTHPVFSIYNFQDSGREEIGSWIDGRIVMAKSVQWPDGFSDTVPDSKPHLLVDYFSCSKGESFNDTRGLVRIDSVDGDPENIEVDSECDGIVDCNNYSDEHFSCDPSLTVAYIVVSILAGIGYLYLLFCLCIIIRYRKRGRVRAVGVVFLLLSTIACIVGISSIFTFIGKPSDPLCVFRVWIITLASGLLIGSLSARQYRVWKVFSNKSINPVVFTELKLCLFTLLLMVPDFILCISWTAFDTPEARPVDGNHLQCTSDYFVVFLVLILVYKAIVSGFSSLLAFLSRHFPGAYSDARLIGFALYNETIVGVILIPIVFVLGSQYFVQWLIITLGILFFLLSTYSIIMLPKLYGILIIDKGKTESDLNELPPPTTGKTDSRGTSRGR